MVPKQDLFHPSRPQTKAESTTKVAKTLIDTETAARETKTRRLRAARIEREASEVKAEVPKPKRRKPVAKVQK